MNQLQLSKLPFESHPSGSGYIARVITCSGKFELSVVAGRYFYSEPREDLGDPEQYSEVELAIFNAETGDWASFNELQKCGAFDIVGQGEYRAKRSYDDEAPIELEYLDEPQSSVFGYIEISKILKLYESI